MKKYLLPIIMLMLCSVLVLSSCGKNSVKAPETLKAELEESGNIVRLYYPTTNVGEYQNAATFCGLSDTNGVENILIAEGGSGKDDAKPLIIFYCDSLETTDRVFDAVKKSVSVIVKNTGMTSEKECNIMNKK